MFILIFAPVIIWLSGCKPRYVCPAYQSSFILDKAIADEAFSPFDPDSMPRLAELVKKTDVLLVVKLGKKKTDKRMAVIPMVTIFPESADSALALADSVGSDSTLVEEEEPEKTEEEMQEELKDSTATEEEELAQPEEGGGEPDLQEVPKEEPEKGAEENAKPKSEEAAPKKKKTDQKDPEISDPGLKAEFEESFGDEPTMEDLNDIPPDTNTAEYIPPAPKAPGKKKSGKKAGNRPDMKPKDDEPAPEDEKF